MLAVQGGDALLGLDLGIHRYLLDLYEQQREDQVTHTLARMTRAQTQQQEEQERE